MVQLEDNFGGSRRMSIDSTMNLRLLENVATLSARL